MNAAAKDAREEKEGRPPPRRSTRRKSEENPSQAQSTHLKRSAVDPDDDRKPSADGGRPTNPQDKMKSMRKKVKDRQDLGRGRRGRSALPVAATEPTEQSLPAFETYAEAALFYSSGWPSLEECELKCKGNDEHSENQKVGGVAQRVFGVNKSDGIARGSNPATNLHKACRSKKKKHSYATFPKENQKIGGAGDLLLHDYVKFATEESISQTGRTWRGALRANMGKYGLRCIGYTPVGQRKLVPYVPPLNGNSKDAIHLNDSNLPHLFEHVEGLFVNGPDGEETAKRIRNLQRLAKVKEEDRTFLIALKKMYHGKKETPAVPEKWEPVKLL